LIRVFPGQTEDLTQKPFHLDALSLLALPPKPMLHRNPPHAQDPTHEAKVLAGALLTAWKGFTREFE
jgi:hypothetical protein